MASCAAGVHVITTDGEAGRYGITMTAVTAVTDEPPTVMLCINTLNDSQQDIAEHFAGLTDLSPEERFEYHIWHRGQTGQLEVEGALAHLHGSIVDQREIGTHYVFFVQLNEIRNTDTQAPALLYFRRQFKYLA